MELISEYAPILLPVVAAIGGGVGWLFRNRRDDMTTIVEGFKDLRDLTKEELQKTIEERDSAKTSMREWKRRCDHCEDHLNKITALIDRVILAVEEGPIEEAKIVLREVTEEMEELRLERRAHAAVTSAASRRPAAST